MTETLQLPGRSLPEATAKLLLRLRQTGALVRTDQFVRQTRQKLSKFETTEAHGFFGYELDDELLRFAKLLLQRGFEMYTGVVMRKGDTNLIPEGKYRRISRLLRDKNVRFVKFSFRDHSLESNMPTTVVIHLCKGYQGRE